MKTKSGLIYDGPLGRSVYTHKVVEISVECLVPDEQNLEKSRPKRMLVARKEVPTVSHAQDYAARFRDLNPGIQVQGWYLERTEV